MEQCYKSHYRPAGLHQSLNAEEESNILFILQVVQHSLHTQEKQNHLMKIWRVILKFRVIPAFNFLLLTFNTLFKNVPYIIESLYLLHIAVTSIEDGDSQFECGGNHGSRLT